MKRRASRIVACTGKHALTAVEAKKLARRMRERGDHRVVPYKCLHCPAWHVGSSVVSEGLRRRPALVDDGRLDG